MEKFIITYKNFVLKKSVIQRLKDDLKNLYWEKPPENWADFDNEIEFKEEQPRGGDCVSLIFAKKVNIRFWDSILKDLSKNSDVFSIEIKTANNEVSRMY